MIAALAALAGLSVVVLCETNIGGQPNKVGFEIMPGLCGDDVVALLCTAGLSRVLQSL